MTDNEIIKGLEQCHRLGKGEIDRIVCGKCPYYNTICCETHLYIDAHSLIKRQKAEIERLNGCVKSEEEVRAIMKSQMMPMVNEIVNEQFDVAVKLARAEAIKEFAERLKGINSVYATDKTLIKELNFVIDNLVKEMVGE